MAYGSISLLFLGFVIISCCFPLRWSVSGNFCPDLQKPSNGTINGKCNGNATTGATCNFTCDSGYYLLGADTLTCEYNGRWDKRPPTCVPTCPILESPTYGSMFGTCNNQPISSGDTCSFRCSGSNFFLEGNSTLTCKDTYEWDHKTPTCVRICPAQKKLDNGAMSGQCKGKILPGNKCKFTCDNGFVMKGAQESTCTDMYDWETLPPTCVKTCKEVNVYNSLGYRGICDGTTKPGEKCMVMCRPDFTLIGNELLVCKSDLEWDNPIPTCESSCPSVRPPPGGWMLGQCSSSAKSGDMCIFGCYSGYKVEGNKDITCGKDLAWSGETPKCVSGAAAMVSLFLVVVLSPALVALLNRS